MANLKIHLDDRGSSKIIKRLCQTVNYLSEVANGDMRTDVYDVNQNGIVDNSELVNGHEVWKDVPVDAKFTDTVYDDSYLQGKVRANSNNIQLIMQTLFDWNENYLIDSQGRQIVDSLGRPIYASSYKSKFDTKGGN